MGTTDAAATTVPASEASDQEQEPVVHRDALFRDSASRLVQLPSFPKGARFADTHTHLDMLQHPDLALARCAVHAVDFLVTVVDPTEDALFSYDQLPSWRESARVLLQEWGISSEVPEVSIIIGCHPHNASRFTPERDQLLAELAQRPITSAIGEIGLDYHYDHSPREAQQRVFRQQIRLAHDLGLPVSLHLREAHEEGLRILQQEGLPEAGALLHCFNLDYATLEPFLELGCQVAFGGPLTFKRSDDVRAAAARTPRERIMTETDAPFMAPHPLRGTTCGPEHVIFTAAKLAEVFALDEDDSLGLYQQLFRNATDFFSRPSVLNPVST